MDKLFSNIEFQYQDESKKYRRLKICKYSFEISKVCILSLATGLSFLNIFAILSGDRTELRSARNYEVHGITKCTELRSARNYEVHGTSKRTELRSSRNFEAHGTSKFVCIFST